MGQLHFHRWNFELPQEFVGGNGDKYVVDEYINKGGNAAVYKCIRSDSGDEFAVKFLLCLDEGDRRRFRQEAEILSQLNHDHIVKYIDSGDLSVVKSKGRNRQNITIPFLVMELATSDLNKYLMKRKFSVGSEEYLGQIRGLSSALSALHEVAVHRDIKPLNILICGERWVLTDFGLCTKPNDALNLTKDYEPLGPRYWMSPEANNRVLGVRSEIVHASDVFQLAAVFWLVINGFHPT
jgi:serine/threonine-protein kinase